MAPQRCRPPVAAFERGLAAPLSCRSIPWSCCAHACGPAWRSKGLSAGPYATCLRAPEQSAIAPAGWLKNQLDHPTTSCRRPLPMRLSLRCTGLAPQLRQRSLTVAAVLQRPTPPSKRLVEQAQQPAAPTQLRPPPVRPPPSARQEGRSPQRMPPPRQQQSQPQPHRRVTLAGAALVGICTAHSLL